MIPGLVDHRNAALLQDLEKTYSIKVELVKDTDEYGCYSKDHRSTIYVPESRICAASFTHELLHIYLRSKGIFIGARLKRRMNASKKLAIIYSEQLLAHMGNCLDHIKMLPIYLELGFDRSKFIHDYEQEKFTSQEVEQIQAHWKEGDILHAPVIEFYLEKYFAARACPNPNFNYRGVWQALSRIDGQLFQINEKMTNRWAAMKIDLEGDLSEDYISIAEDYVAEMERWAASRIIK